MKKLRSLLTVVLILALVFTSLMPVISAENVPPEESENVIAPDTDQPGDEVLSSPGEQRGRGRRSRFDDWDIEGNTEVTAIVIFDENGVIDIDANLKSARAKRAESSMRDGQRGFVSRMKSRMNVTLLYQYTVLANGIAIKTSYKNLKLIEEMEGVQAVYLDNAYSVPDTVQSIPSHAFTNMIAADWIWPPPYGCIGDGMVIALLDTGLLTSHEAFKDYGRIENPRLSEADVNAAGTSVRGKYLSAKIPFAYDYADKDDNVNPSKNTPSGDHGTHVAGIAAGYAEKGGVITFQGVSPNAQLLIMKVFSDSNSLTWASTYFYALEDAHRLGADVINLSLGTVGGFTYDAALETDLFGNIYKTLRDAGVIVSVAVGNASSMGVNAENSLSKDYGWEAVYADYVDYGTVGSPSTYTGNLAVSSVECTDYFAYTIEVNGISHQYTDAASDPAPQTPAEESLIFLKRFRGQTLEYVMVPGFGRVSDYVGLDVKGKVAVVDRGYDFGPPSLTFAGKMQNAKDAGAIAVIIYNDLDDGLWFMNIPTYTIPAIFVKKDAGAALQKLANETVSPALPTLRVADNMLSEANRNAWQVSSFSGWGTTSDLRIVPQITAPGGMINSASWTGDDLYHVNSGTSMAAPAVAGAMANLMMYVDKFYGEKWMLGDADLSGRVTAADAAKILRVLVELDEFENDRARFQADCNQDGRINAADAAKILRYLVELDTLPGEINMMKKTDRAGISEALALSTARILEDKDKVPYSPRAQGAGMMKLSHAAQSDAYISGALQELGDDKDKTGRYAMSFDVVNLGDKTLTYTVAPTVLRDYASTALGDTYNLLSSVKADFTFTTNGSATNHTVTVPPKGTVTVNVVIMLTDGPTGEKTKLNNLFPNGTFVEGFVVLTPTVPTGVEPVAIHATFLAFYGDWTAQSILESADFGDVINARFNKTNPYLMRQNVGFNKAFITNASGGYYPSGSTVNNGKFLGENAFVSSAYDPDKNAISNRNSDARSYFAERVQGFPMQLRNARRMIMVVTNAQTGEVYAAVDKPYVRKAVYDASRGGYRNQTYLDWNGAYWDGSFVWNGTNAAGQLVANNTKVQINYYAWLDFEKSVEANYQALGIKTTADYSKLNTTAWSDWKVWSYPLTVDNQAPTIEKIERSGSTLNITVSDNQYIMAVLVRVPNLDWDATPKSVTMTQGGSATVSFTLPAGASGTVNIEVIDYATNRPGWTYTLKADPKDDTLEKRP